MTRACATCFFHDGTVCHLHPKAETTSKFYWCREWYLDWNKTCPETRETESQGKFTTRTVYTTFRCTHLAGHTGDHAFSWKSSKHKEDE